MELELELELGATPEHEQQAHEGEREREKEKAGEIQVTVQRANAWDTMHKVQAQSRKVLTGPAACRVSAKDRTIGFGRKQVGTDPTQSV